MTTYRTEGWEDKTTADLINEVNGWYDQDNVSNGPIVDTTFARTGSRSLKYTIPLNTIFAGMVRNWLGSGHNGAGVTFGGGSTIHVRWYSYWSTNFLFVPGGSGSKSLYLNSWDAFKGTNNWRVRFAYTGNGGGDTTGHHTIDCYPEDSHLQINQGSPTDLIRGQWQLIELGVTLNTFASGAANAAANADGRIRWWVDEHLNADHNNIAVRATQVGGGGGGNNAPNNPINAIGFDQYFGGIEENAHPEQYVWIDDVVIADSYIGPAGGGSSLTIDESATDWCAREMQTNPLTISKW